MANTNFSGVIQSWPAGAGALRHALWTTTALIHNFTSDGPPAIPSRQPGRMPITPDLSSLDRTANGLDGHASDVRDRVIRLVTAMTNGQLGLAGSHRISADRPKTCLAT